MRQGFVDVPLETPEDLAEENERIFSKPLNYASLLAGYVLIISAACFCAKIAPAKVEHSEIRGLVPELFNKWFMLNVSFWKETPMTFLDVAMRFSGIEWIMMSKVDIGVELDYHLKSKVNRFQESINKTFEVVPMGHSTEKVSLFREKYLPRDKEINIIMNITAPSLITDQYVLDVTTGSHRCLTVLKALKIVFFVMVAACLTQKKNIYAGAALLGLLPVDHFLCNYVIVCSFLLLWINKFWQIPVIGKIAATAGIVILEIGWLDASFNWMNGVCSLIQFGIFVAALATGLNVVSMMPYILIPMITSILVHLGEFQSAYWGTIIPDVLVISSHAAAIAAMIILDY